MGVRTISYRRAVRTHTVQHLRSLRCGLAVGFHREVPQRSLIGLGASMADDEGL